MFYAIAANLPFWSACPLVGLALDGYFCLEYCLIGILALCAPRLVTSVGLILIMSLDVANAISETYGVPLVQCLANLAAFSSFSRSRLAHLVLLLLVCGVTVWTGAAIPVRCLSTRQRLKTGACLVLFTTTSLLIDYSTTVRRLGHAVNPLKHGFHESGDLITPSYFAVFRPSRLPSMRLLRSETNYLKTRANFSADRNPPATQNAAGLAEPLIRTIPSHHPEILPNLVLVVVESWGVHEDPAVNQALLAPYNGLETSGRYHLVTGTVPYFGFTMAGEGRELCASRIGYQLEDASPAQLSGCLPDRLNALGYKTIALHGMDGRFFNRARWYRTIGFQQTEFKGDFESEGLPECLGAFVGTCDADVARWIGIELTTSVERPEFVYWVTLNSHLPVLVPSPLHQDTDCVELPLLRRKPSLCSWHQLVLNVHRSLARVAGGRTHRPTIFVIVGDHGPPFSNAQSRSEFSSAVVPFIMLVPHGIVKAAVGPLGPSMATPK